MIPQERYDLCQLIDAACNGELADERVPVLERRLSEDRAACEEYVQLLQLQSELYLLLRARRASKPVMAIASVLAAAPAPSREVEIAPTLRLHRTIAGYLSHPVRFGLFFASLTTVSLLLTAAQLPVPRALAPQISRVQESAAPARQPAAHVRAAKEARWSPGCSLAANAALLAGQTLRLESGLAEIIYSDGTALDLIGPAQLQIESEQSSFLYAGRILARATPGFTLHTPQATIVDRGTQFGVLVDEQGRAEVHVFDGRVDVAARGSDAPLRLGRGDAVRCGAAHAPPELLAADMAIFQTAPGEARRPESGSPVRALDLLSVVAGGTGLHTQREAGINPRTGRRETQFRPGYQMSTGRYTRTPWHPLIDGVFIPDADRGAVVLNSVGDEYDTFPPFESRCYGTIWSRGAEPLRDISRVDRSRWVYWLENLERYSPAGHGVLAMASNIGITFDLAAVRKRLAPQQPHALSGTLANAALHASEAADAWIFLDDQLQWQRLAIRSTEAPQQVDVEISPTARFLTLVVTDGGDTPHRDWIVWGDLQLELEAIEPAASHAP